MNFIDQRDKIVHDAHMISFRILSEIEKECDSRGIKKSDLAGMVGTSKSYITQLFRGDKMVNATFFSKIENILNIRFETKIVKP